MRQGDGTSNLVRNARCLISSRASKNHLDTKKRPIRRGGELLKSLNFRKKIYVHEIWLET